MITQNKNDWVQRSWLCPVETVLEFRGTEKSGLVCKGIVQLDWYDTKGNRLKKPWRKFCIYNKELRDFTPDKATWDKITHWRHP